ncbi:MAG TPA: hypothetical protein VN253_02760 [Kofleriaceae bacterium]|nr:hypothetical protein [Kofleriaceae bacterium]
MNPDIITSATNPRDLRPAGRAVRPPAREPGGAHDAFRSPGESLRSFAWTKLESVARTLILSVASVSRQRALGALVDRHAAAEDAKQQAMEVAAAAHVLRVRTRLSEAEQRLFDDLLRDGALEDLLAQLVRRTDDEALELLRRRLGTPEPVVTIASLARLIGSLRAGLTSEEYDRIIMRLPHLSLDEQRSLHAHLRTMTPVDAAMLLRGYLVPARS